MGRRALPKIDPSISFDSLISEVADLDDSYSLENHFGRTAPIEIEIGSGKGLFLLNASGAHPHRNYLGIEIAKKYARFSAYRLAKFERTNARILRGDGLKFFAERLGDSSVAAVHVYFPDPWWKERHRRRRVMQPAFVRDVHRVLEPGGILHFWTDVEEYYESTIALVAEEVPFNGPHAVEVSEAEHDMDYRTHFERRMRKNDHPVFRCTFSKDL